MNLRDPSSRQLWLLWGISAVFGIFLTVAIVASAARHEYLLPTVVPAAVVLSVVLAYFQKRKLTRLFQQPSLDVVLDFYQKRMAAMPRHAVVYTSALAAVFYGDFERAERLLGEVTWDGRGGIYESFPLHVEALVLFWRDRDYRRGLAVARRGRELADVGRGLPGAGMSRRAYDVLVAVGQVLSRLDGPETIRVLEEGRRLPFMGNLVARWALAAHHARRGARDEADVELAEIRKIAPYCTPLHSVP